MRKHLIKIKTYMLARKILSSIIIIVLLLGGYLIYKKATSTAGDARYIIGNVKRGDIVASISGSGQISSTDQIDIKPKASGNITYIAVQNGQIVNAGALIATIDNKDAQKTVRDAEINLESSKISLEKLKIEKSKENMNADLAQSYDDGFNTVSNVFLDLPGVMTGLDDMFFESNIGTGQWNVDWYEGQVGNTEREQTVLFKKRFIDSYNLAKKTYDKSFDNYKIVSRTSDYGTIENLIVETYDTTKLISDAIKSANNYIDFVNSSIEKNDYDTPTIITTHKTSLSTYTSKTNTHLINLLSIKTNIKDYKDAFPNSDLDIQSAELSLKQKENALQDAKDKLADYSIRAPFGGTIATINVKKTDGVNLSTVVATLITQKQFALVSLNEVDVAKIKIGQKTDLTFDAIPELKITGEVVEIDSLGTVSQGVVTYNVKIAFETNNSNIKPGMSVSADIITETKNNILIVPNSAIKSQRGENYVETFDTELQKPTDGLMGSLSKIPLRKINVVIGIANDTETEIISGLKEDEKIVVRTILPSSTSATAPSIFGGGNKR